MNATREATKSSATKQQVAKQLARRNRRNKPNPKSPSAVKRHDGDRPRGRCPRGTQWESLDDDGRTYVAELEKLFDDTLDF